MDPYNTVDTMTKAGPVDLHSERDANVALAEGIQVNEHPGLDDLSVNELAGLIRLTMNIPNK